MWGFPINVGSFSSFTISKLARLCNYLIYKIVLESKVAKIMWISQLKFSMLI